MRNIVKQNKQFLLAFFGVLLIILSCSIFVSNSDMLTGEVAIKSIVPVYDENDTYSVGNTGVIFNDKDQVVKYNVVIENRKDYDVKVSDLQLGTKSEEFLNYTVENVNVDDVIKAGESKELVVSFETVKMDGWGRNFNDELVTTLVFDEVKKQEEVVTPPVVDTKPNTNVPTNKVENNTSNNVQPEVNEPVVNEPVIEQPKEEVKDDVVTTPEDNINHELGMNQEIIVKDAHNEDLFVIFCFGVATGVLGIGLVMVNKNKFTKYIVLFVIVGSSVKLASANEVFSLEIPINVSYESQNVMKPSGCDYDLEYEETYWCDDYWVYNWQITNFYIVNEITKFEEYAYQFDVSKDGNGKVIATMLVNEDDSSTYDLYLQADGIIYANEDASYYFADFYHISEITNSKGLDTSMVKDMSYMFMNMGSYVDEFKLSFEFLDTSNVTNMRYMFKNTGSFCENIVLDLSNFDTSNVTNMREMFSGSGYKASNFTLDVSNFDTSKVTDMSYMFSSTGEHVTTFTLDVSNFDTSKVTDMRSMFSYTGYSSEVFTLDLSNFDTSNVTDMGYMFSSAGWNSKNFTLDVSGFDTSKVTNMSGMFINTGYNNENFTFDVSNFDTSNVTDMSFMFNNTGYNSENFTFDISNFDTSNVTNMIYMFSETGYNSETFTLDLSSFDTSNVTDMRGMFYRTGYNSSNFILDVSNFDTSNVTDMSNMFTGTGYNSTNFNTSITIKNPNMSSYSYMSMFENVATQQGSKIIVNYTSETEALVDKMIATKSANSNVVKGENIEIGYLKLFPLNNNGDSEIFNFIIGMTWSEWINSEYNTKGFTISGNKILYQGKYTVTQETESGSKRVVSPNDLIISGYPCYYEQASLA